MTDNPFEALTGGGGGLDLGALLQQAQQMQSDMQAAQERLADSSVEGSVAGGAVTVTVSGLGELTGVTITPAALASVDEDALADLGDLVVAAFRDARAKVDDLAREALGPMAQGIPGMPGQPGQTPGQLGF